jgi:hypothetical protein
MVTGVLKSIARGAVNGYALAHKKRNRETIAEHAGMFMHAPQGQFERLVHKGVALTTAKLQGLKMNLNNLTNLQPPTRAPPKRNNWFTVKRAILLCILVFILSLIAFQVLTRH